MKAFGSRRRARAIRKMLRVGIALVAALLIGGAAASVPTSVQTQDSVDTLALKWFAEMKTGRIDRTELTPEYSAQLSNDAVQSMSRYLKEHDYGTSPLRAEVVQTRKIGSQSLYVVKLIFPRGDAASLMFGFNVQGKITGISLLSMAGD